MGNKATAVLRVIQIGTEDGNRPNRSVNEEGFEQQYGGNSAVGMSGGGFHAHLPRVLRENDTVTFRGKISDNAQWLTIIFSQHGSDEACNITLNFATQTITANGQEQMWNEELVPGSNFIFTLLIGKKNGGSHSGDYTVKLYSYGSEDELTNDNEATSYHSETFINSQVLENIQFLKVIGDIDKLDTLCFRFA